MPFVADIQKMFGRIFPKKEDNDEANLSRSKPKTFVLNVTTLPFGLSASAMPVPSLNPTSSG